MVSAVMSVLAVYMWVRTVMPLKIKWPYKAILTVLLLAAALKFSIFRWIGGGDFFAPELPDWLLIGGAWAFGVFLIFALLVIAADAAQLVLWLGGRIFHRSEQVSRLIRRRVVLNIALLALALALAGAGIVNALSMPEVRPRTIQLKNLPPEFDGVTIAVLADLHVDALTGADKISALCARVNALRPDMIVLVGDFVDGGVAERAEDVRGLAQLSAPLGVFGVPGNHEYYYYGDGEWFRFLPSLGIDMLLNRNVTLYRGNAALTVAGVTDPAAGRMQLEQPDAQKALAGAPAGAVKILLAHNPRLVRHIPDGVDLQISGHTHGGMIRGFDLLIARFNSGLVSGEYHIGDTVLYVSNGTFIWNGFPIRLGRPSEITLLTLKNPASPVARAGDGR